MPTNRTLLLAMLGIASIVSCSSHVPAVVTIAPATGERHLSNIRQLTNGGENAEAYFSSDGGRLIFQSTRDGRACDQEFVMNIDVRTSIACPPAPGRRPAVSSTRMTSA